MDIDSLDEELDDTSLLGREKLVPQGVESLQRLPHIDFRNLLT